MRCLQDGCFCLFFLDGRSEHQEFETDGDTAQPFCGNTTHINTTTTKSWTTAQQSKATGRPWFTSKTTCKMRPKRFEFFFFFFFLNRRYTQRYHITQRHRSLQIRYSVYCTWKVLDRCFEKVFESLCWYQSTPLS